MTRRRRCISLLMQCTITVWVLLGWVAHGLSPSSSNHNNNNSRNHRPSSQLERRAFLTTAVGGVGGALCTGSAPALATTDAAAAAAVAAPATRDDLLRAIAQNKPESEVLRVIERLPATRDAAVGLDGAWKLLWSCKADAFSPLLQLPPPFRPASYQYLGPEAAREVGEGRLAQGLTGGVLLRSNQLWLSSGAAVDGEDPSIIKILPPFRLQLGGREGSGKPKTTLVQAGSDADFRKVNARTVAAQRAGANLYQQLYLERSGGGAGALRVSKIVAGDPVIVGAVFVHQKLY